MIDFNPSPPKSTSSSSLTSVPTRPELINIRILSLLPSLKSGVSKPSPISGKALDSFLASLSQNLFQGNIVSSNTLSSPIGRFVLDSGVISHLPINTKVKFQVNRDHTLNLQVLSSPSTPKSVNSPNPTSLIGQTTLVSVIRDPPVSSSLSRLLFQAPSSSPTPDLSSPSITASQLSVLRSILTSSSSGGTSPRNDSGASARPVYVNILSSTSASNLPNVPQTIFQGSVAHLSSPSPSSTPAGHSATIKFFGGTLILDSPSPQTFSALSQGQNIHFSLSQKADPLFSSQSIAARFLSVSESPLSRPQASSGSTTPSSVAPTNPNSPISVPDNNFPQLIKGDNLKLKIISVTLPNNTELSSTTKSSSPSPSNSFTATLLPTSSSSSTQVATSPLGLIAFNSPLGLPPYSKLSLSLEPSPSPNQEKLPHVILKTIEELFPVERTSQISQQTIQTLLPQTNSPQLTVALIFLLNAVAKGKYQQWLGNNLSNVLSLKKNSQAKIIKEAFVNPSKHNKNPSSRNWNWFSLPIVNNNSLDNLLFAYLPQEQEENNDPKNHNSPPNEHLFRISSRFSQSGLIQIEGHIQNFDDKSTLKPRNFSLMVANEPPLSPEVKQNIGKIFMATSEALGFSPHIIFRENIDPSWLNP